EGALAGAPATGVAHVYVRDLASATTLLVSRAEGLEGVSAEAESRSPALDGNGEEVVFTARGSNLEAKSPNPQVFVRTIAIGHNRIVSRANGVTGAFAAAAVNPSVDAVGDRVSFAAAGLQSTTQHYEIYVRDLSSETVTLASRADGIGGTSADGTSETSSLSANGNCLAFTSQSSNLGDGAISPDFIAVHLRVLSGECSPPLPEQDSEPPPPPRQLQKDAITRLKIAPSRFKAAARGASVQAASVAARAQEAATINDKGHSKPTGRRRSKPGAIVSYTGTVAATTTLTVLRAVPGRRSGKKCVRATRHNKRHRRCTRFVKVGSFTHKDAAAGTIRFRFSGRVSGRKLKPGRYRLTAVARNPAGAGSPLSISFTVVR
ncbi:MAG TPA: hypothetical protein VH025_04085, partial [Solirubrobacteraceae bacterium]|nr:hypothetical protein [Solirubrobacteraceae bacterium]